MSAADARPNPISKADHPSSSLSAAQSEVLSQARSASQAPSARRIWNLPARAAYLHVPFCHRRCGYCTFTLVAGRDDLVEPYLEAIGAELRRLGQPQEVDTLYFGGGTPTRLHADSMRRLAQLATGQFPLVRDYEWTVEANPCDIHEPYARGLAELGVNRLSLGGQSFQAEKLRRLDRDHSPAELERAAVIARQHFEVLSLDLIFGVWGETLASWQDDLESAIALRPEHLSLYGLTYERGARIWGRRLRGELIPVAEEAEREMYEWAIDRLQSAGYEHYEISNFALPGRRCRHNETYWSGAAYFGVGPGASSFLSGHRRTNHQSTTTWLKRVLGGMSPVAEEDPLADDDRARELLVFGLRRREGWSRAEFLARTGKAIDELVGPVLRRFVEQGWLADDGQRVCLTRSGLMISDALWPDFLAD